MSFINDLVLACLRLFFFKPVAWLLYLGQLLFYFGTGNTEVSEHLIKNASVVLTRAVQ